VTANAVDEGTATLHPATNRYGNVAQCGIAIEADIERILASEPCFARLSGQLGDVLGRQLPMSLKLSGLCGDADGRQLERFCRQLAHALDAPGSHTSLLEISIKGKDPLPDVAWRIRREILGAGPLNILCDEGSIAVDGFWQSLWRLRAEPMVSIACWPQVRSPCALLTTECAGNLLPKIGLQAPSESAWVSASISLQDYTDSRDELDSDALATELVNILSQLDSMHRVARWPTAAMRHDAWMNRRLAIQVDGLGDYALRRGLDPHKHESLQTLRQVLLRIRRVLRLESQVVAASTDMLPAIKLSNPASGLGAGPAKDGWEQRWLRAVDRTGVRHRNLLVLSPWSLFPSEEATVGFRDLTPLLRLADACVFRERPPLGHWTFNEFKHFHQGVWAQTCHLESNALVAERL
jgi:hypothetical protein